MRKAVSITGNSMDQVIGFLGDLNLAERLRREHEIDYRDFIVEWRIDLVRDLDLEKPRRDLERFQATCYSPSILTCRDPDQAGPDKETHFRGTEEQRVNILQTGIELEFAYVDVEHSNRHLIKPNGGKTIIIGSYHDFNGTPDYDVLKDEHDRMSGSPVDIVKMATMARSMEDSRNMMRLVKQSGRTPTIGICMGDYGKITRVLGPIYGGYLTFASLAEGRASAAGQMNAGELHEKIEKAVELYDAGKIKDPEDATVEDFERYCKLLDIKAA